MKPGKTALAKIVNAAHQASPELDRALRAVAKVRATVDLERCWAEAQTTFATPFENAMED